MDQTRRRGGRSSGDQKASGAKAEVNRTGEQQQGGRHSSRGWCSLICGIIGVCILALVVIVALLPCPIDPQPFSLPPPPEWTGEMAPNDKLTRAERVFENLVAGPESIVRDGEYLYTGLSDGRVVSINRGEIQTLARFGKGTDCGSFDSEPTCGRPLGMRLDKDGYLLVADGYLGIYRVNVATGQFHQLLSSEYPMAGKLPKLLNDLEEGPNGTIFFTDSSSRWDRRHNRYAIMEGETTGRLLSYNPDTLELKELMVDLGFANGVSIAYDRVSVLVVETTMARIWRYFFTGPRQGEVETFAENLPGLPDNIRRSGRGTYWVGMAAIRRAGTRSFLDMSAPYPWMRRLVAKVIPQELIMALIPKYGLLIELDKEGRIIRSLHDPTGQQVPAVSEAEEKDGMLYLGSYSSPFLTRVYLHGK